MKIYLVLPFIFISGLLARPAFDDYFENKTLRIDYSHTGTADAEIFSLEQVYEEGEWPGTRQHIVNDLNLGSYQACVYDADSRELIFNYGFCSIFAEWKTTDEAINGIHRTMHETVRIPFPKKPIIFSLAKRDVNNDFAELWSTEIDPHSRFVNREKKKIPFKVEKVIDNGLPYAKVDLLILGDGYTKKELKKFRRHVRRYTDVLFASAPFAERKEDFNVWTIEVISGDSGIDQPRKNIWKDNALGSTFNFFDVERYVLTLENRRLRDIASVLPYDAIIILFNTPRYGGGGIYNCFATCYTGQPANSPDWWSDYVFVHEFGHSFAGLADEYYSSDVAYNDMYPLHVEPWEPNITTLQMDGQPKWHASLTDDVDIPTDWNKSAYDSLSHLRGELRETDPDYETKRDVIDGQLQAMLNAENFDVVGCFEGGGYASSGIYRPSLNCRMFSKSLVEFCPVCEEAIRRVIDYYIE
ncbi:peptidase M64 [candidate division KSB1 bacterium]|nr:peptidase M64 [candidate division KSB1 bacterium]RQW10449.1 MAG: peptidase M64 [candidate division KSB1 bacterium]